MSLLLAFIGEAPADTTRPHWRDNLRNRAIVRMRIAGRSKIGVAAAPQLRVTAQLLQTKSIRVTQRPGKGQLIWRLDTTAPVTTVVPVWFIRGLPKRNRKHNRPSQQLYVVFLSEPAAPEAPGVSIYIPTFRPRRGR